MSQNRVLRLAFVWTVVLGWAATAAAGDISGIVKHADGSPASDIKISGLTAGALGGTTKTVRTDKKGKFTLSWKSKGGLAKLYAKGNVVRTDVADGEYVVIKLK